MAKVVIKAKDPIKAKHRKKTYENLTEKEKNEILKDIFSKNGYIDAGDEV